MQLQLFWIPLITYINENTCNNYKRTAKAIELQEISIILTTGILSIPPPHIC